MGRSLDVSLSPSAGVVESELPPWAAGRAGSSSHLAPTFPAVPWHLLQGVPLIYVVLVFLISRREEQRLQEVGMQIALR